MGEEGTKLICEAMKGNKTVKELDLSGIIDLSGQVISNIGGAAGAEHVAALLRDSTSVTSINLASNNIGGYYPPEAQSADDFIATPEGPQAIADAIRVSASLTYLWYKLRTQTPKLASKMVVPLCVVV